MENIEAVVLTGGSSGLGKSFIHQFRRLNDRAAICNLSRTHPGFNFPVRHVAADLAKRTELERAAHEVSAFLERVQGPVLLVNNSGFGAYGHFPIPSLDHQLEMIDVNVKAAVHLTGLLLPALKTRGGAIVNIASTAAFQPTPYMATYGGTKAFLLHWSLSLSEELRGSDLRVLAVCPGPAKTGFFRRAGFEHPVVSPRLSQSPEQVIAETFAALRRKRSLVVTGRKNRLLVFLSSRIGKAAAARLGEKILQRYGSGQS